MPQRPVRPVENFTRSFLVTAFVLLFSVLFVVWAAFGYGWALALAGAIWLVLRLTSS